MVSQVYAADERHRTSDAKYTGGHRSGVEGTGESAKIFNRLMSLLLEGAKHPEVRNEHWLVREEQLIERLGKIHSKKSIKALVSLSSYELGSAGSELLVCLLLREAKRSRFTVTEALKTAQHECSNQAHSRQAICKPEEIWRGDIQYLREAVQKGEPCDEDGGEEAAL
jgi:hypothetical protein